jgi:hypothetical protein
MIDWFLALPDAIQASLVVGILAASVSLISAIVSMVSASTSRTQATTSQQALFTSLLERRIKWLDEFTNAVRARENEILAIPKGGINAYVDDLLSNPPEAPATLSDATRSAHWLFDESVASIARDISILLQNRCELIITARTPPNIDKLVDPDAFLAAQEAGAIGLQIEVKLEALVLAIQSYTYVGDVKRPEDVLKNAPMITG